LLRVLGACSCARAADAMSITAGRAMATNEFFIEKLF
jgi:hypothetical protein